jgi:two-component sensor histidine kinase
VTNTAVAHPPDLDGRTLVRELTHRINNQLSSAIDVVTAAAVRADNPEAKVALGKVVELLQEQANVQRVLTVPEGNALVDVAQYLRKLCLATTRSRLEPIGVHLSFQADTLPLEPERCWRLGMALHELMTNSAQHACFDDRAGEIKVKLSLAQPVVNCIIVDNGSLFERLKPARGLGLVRDLIKSLGGRLEYGFGPEYSSFLLVFLLTERERRANRSVASRRARTRAERVIIAMQHAAKGKSKIVQKCTLPLTSARRIDLVVTDLAVIGFQGSRMTLLETAPGVSVAEVMAATEAELSVPDNVPEMKV